MNESHIAFMNRALTLAEIAKGRTSPNPLVGAVVVKDGKIIAEGYHKKVGGPHAEIHALDAAGEKNHGATLYVTLEPCCHWGRTPPCTKAIINSGIANVYVAHLDPNPKVAGKGIQELEKAGIKTNVGVCAEAAKILNEVYIKHITTGYPFVILKTAMSLDGKIATTTGESQWITSESSRQKVHEIRDQIDAIIVGVGTVLSDNPTLTTRLPDKKGKDPIRIVLDSHARTPLTARVINPNSHAKVIVAVTPQASKEKVAKLEKRHAEVIVIPEKEGRVCFKTLMQTLGARGITSVLVEGGGKVNASVLESGMVDKVMCFIAPIFIGGRQAPGIIDGDGINRLIDAPELQRLTVTKLHKDLLIEGYFTQKCLQG
ncbi:bifunctional diaminohydroxyphosphoribosylaminopyrimidine deaminase/5-amino-6-(5-phosphoribosylamino)uracil reductase RibD [Candidatus Poribacteria bacterium]|nr:MAG: bifunctional diaminohydroxyphosphoribosylaminopyrimidine deaminase/5-amino-6-(5-phosphoribosylamino)uracil reductase RibD [Candidatus Poribacteria bacterium]